MRACHHRNSLSFCHPERSEDELLRTCPKNLGNIKWVLPRFFLYSKTYASIPKKMRKVDGFRPAFITFVPR